MQNSYSFHGVGYTFWTFWIIALHLLFKLWISNILATSITEKTCIVEMRIWCKKIGTVNFIKEKEYVFIFSHYLNKILNSLSRSHETATLVCCKNRPLHPIDSLCGYQWDVYHIKHKMLTCQSNWCWQTNDHNSYHEDQCKGKVDL